jgi:G3E family GTPase
VLGPTVVLLDVTQAQKLLAYDSTQRLVRTQLQDATIIALSKVDGVAVAALDRLEQAVREINGTAEIVRLSVVTGEGLSSLAGRLHQSAAVAGEPGRAHTAGN